MTTTAIVRAPPSSLDARITTFVERRDIDLRLALEQWKSHVRTLSASGVRVVVLPREDALPDSWFCEDIGVCLSHNKTVVFASSVEMTRRPEAKKATEFFAAVGWRTVEPPADVEFDGGDVVLFDAGRRALVGASLRTSWQSAEWLVRSLSDLGLKRVSAIDVSGCIHLSTACSQIDPFGRAWVLNQTWIDAGALSRAIGDIGVSNKFVNVSENEQLAANVLLLPDGSIVAPAEHPSTNAAIAFVTGRRVVELKMSEVLSCEGGPTCLSLRFTS